MFAGRKALYNKIKNNNQSPGRGIRPRVCCVLTSRCDGDFICEVKARRKGSDDDQSSVQLVTSFGEDRDAITWKDCVFLTITE